MRFISSNIGFDMFCVVSQTARVLGRRVLRRMDRHLQSSNAGESIDEVESDDENAM
jgi:hypothetical protein